MSDLRVELEAIEEKHGVLTAAGVEAEARPKRHPLHNRFLWNNAEAGYQYRLMQAEKLIRSVKVRHVAADPAADTTVRQWHAIRGDGTFESIETIRENPLSHKLLLVQAERDWRAVYRRWSHLSEFLAVVRADVG